MEISFVALHCVRQASALLSVVAAACPIVKPGVAMLGKTLQLADRIQMADYLEQVRFLVAKALSAAEGLTGSFSRDCDVPQPPLTSALMYASTSR